MRLAERGLLAASGARRARWVERMRTAGLGPGEVMVHGGTRPGEVMVHGGTRPGEVMLRGGTGPAR